MELDHDFMTELTVEQVAHIYNISVRNEKAMKGPIVAIESVCNRVQHKYCTAIHLGQFSKS